MELLVLFTQAIVKIAEADPGLAGRLAGEHDGKKDAAFVLRRDELIDYLLGHGASEPWLGRMLNVDHTTVHYAKARIAERRAAKARRGAE